MTEIEIARRLVRKALAAGYMVSVYDGEDYPVKKSRDAKVIIDALQSTDSDTLVIRSATGERLGFVLLIWGNGDDLISDASDNLAMSELIGF